MSWNSYIALLVELFTENGAGLKMVQNTFL